MRVSGFLLGIVGFIVLIAFTGICAIFTYGLSRDTAIDFWENGIAVESAGEVVQAVFNPQDFEALPTATPGQVEVVIPSITPISTIAPVVATQNSATLVPVEQTQATATIPVTLEATEQFAAQRWGDPREINILLMGIDERVGFTTETAYRTDTMMVLHIDPVRKTAGVISFPRDLWVDLPGYNESSRLNPKLVLTTPSF